MLVSLRILNFLSPFSHSQWIISWPPITRITSICWRLQPRPSPPQLPTAHLTCTSIFPKQSPRLLTWLTRAFLLSISAPSNRLHEPETYRHSWLLLSPPRLAKSSSNNSSNDNSWYLLDIYYVPVLTKYFIYLAHLILITTPYILWLSPFYKRGHWHKTSCLLHLINQSSVLHFPLPLP